MTKYIFSASVLFAVFLSQCTNKSETDKTNPLKSESIFNPNGSSELSLLMREMYDSSAQLKIRIEEKKQLGDFPVEFNKLNAATPTDSTTKKPSYDAFAENYLSALKSVYQTDSGNIVAKYNEAINSCLYCHSEHCPGSMPKIKKLLIIHKTGRISTFPK